MKKSKWSRSYAFKFQAVGSLPPSLCRVKLHMILDKYKGLWCQWYLNVFIPYDEIFTTVVWNI